jgi:hypothetical protein
MDGVAFQHRGGLVSSILFRVALAVRTWPHTLNPLLCGAIPPTGLDLIVPLVQRLPCVPCSCPTSVVAV